MFTFQICDTSYGAKMYNIIFIYYTLKNRRIGKLRFNHLISCLAQKIQQRKRNENLPMFKYFHYPDNSFFQKPRPHDVAKSRVTILWANVNVTI